MLVLRCLLMILLACSCDASTIRGPLRLHPENPRYLQDAATGRPVIIATFGCVGPGSMAIDYPAEIRRAAAQGMPYVRMWHWLPWEGERAIWPWPRVSAAGEPPKYDLDAWNPTYWARLRDCMERCRRAGIVVEIMLFEACGMKEAPNRWRCNPWAADRNINAIGLPQSAAQGVPAFYAFRENPRLRGLQERYLRKMIDETAAYPNVLYEIENEHYPGGEPEWTRHYAAFVRGLLEARKPAAPRLISQTTDLETCWSTPAVDIANHHSDSTDADAYNRLLEENWPRGKAINVDELANGQTSFDALRRVCWTIVASGGHFHIEDARPSAKPDAIARNILRFCAESGWDFVHAAPDRSRIRGAAGACMVQPGVEAVCYIRTGEVVGLELPAGRYTSRWWDPRDGGFRGEAGFEHAGGLREFRTPDARDWVLQVRVRRR